MLVILQYKFSYSITGARFAKHNANAFSFKVVAEFDRESIFSYETPEKQVCLLEIFSESEFMSLKVIFSTEHLFLWFVTDQPETLELSKNNNNDLY